MTRPAAWPYPAFGTPTWLRPPGDDWALDSARRLALSLVETGATDGRPQLLLDAVARARDVAERLEWVVLSLVGEARGEGLSWDQVAAALGVSKQAAHARYASLVADAYARAGAGQDTD